MTFKSTNGSSIILPTPGVMVRGELHYIDEKGSYIGTNGSDVYSLDISMKIEHKQDMHLKTPFMHT